MFEHFNLTSSKMKTMKWICRTMMIITVQVAANEPESKKTRRLLFDQNISQ